MRNPALFPITTVERYRHLDTQAEMDLFNLANTRQGLEDGACSLTDPELFDGFQELRQKEPYWFRYIAMRNAEERAERLAQVGQSFPAKSHR